jgi:hypothetical protein
MATIQLRRHITGGAIPPPAALNPGEPFFNLPGFTGGGPNSLWIDNGTALVALVDSTRQVELAGAQTINGVKTFASVANLRVIGGVQDDVLITDGAGNLRFGVGGGTGGISSVVSDATLTGDGVAPATALSVVPATAGARGAVNVPAGSALTLTGSALGMAVAAGAAIAGGVENTLPITSAGLRLVMGADVAALQTTAKVVVPAINELNNAIAGLTGNLVFGGTYDVATDTVTPSPNPINPIPPGALPPATAARRGWYVICTTGGAPVGGSNAPVPPGGTYTRGDWIICDATPAWVPVQVGGAVLTAANVNITTIPPLTATNVQDALAQIVARSLTEVATDGSLFGLGTVASPLSVDIVDGGTY